MYPKKLAKWGILAASTSKLQSTLLQFLLSILYFHGFQVSQECPIDIPESLVFLRHYPLKFAAKVVETIPAFFHFAQQMKTVPEAISPHGFGPAHYNSISHTPSSRR
jgi:hypothetical protein